MAGKNPSRAVSNFLRPIRQTLSCITRVGLTYQPPTEANTDYVLALGNKMGPVALQGNPSHSLTFLMNYRVVRADGARGPWKVKTTAYLYRIAGAAGEELVSYHWSPTTPGTVNYPHIHVTGRLKKIHFPTGRISVEEIVRLLIKEFTTPPLRADWENVLAKQQRKFEQYRTWPAAAIQRLPN